MIPKLRRLGKVLEPRYHDNQKRKILGANETIRTYHISSHRKLFID